MSEKELYQRLAVMETIAHNLVEHMQKEDTLFERLESKIDKLNEKNEIRLSAIEKTQTKHSVYWKLVGTFLGSSTVLGAIVTALLN